MNKHSDEINTKEIRYSNTDIEVLAEFVGKFPFEKTPIKLHNMLQNINI